MRSSSRRLEPPLRDPEKWFAAQFGAQGPAGKNTLDYLSVDRAAGVVLKAVLPGARDLHAAVAHLALATQKTAGLRQVWLVVLDSKLTTARLEAEWKQLLRILQPEIARKLGLLVLGGVGTEGPVAWSSRPLGALEPLGEWAKKQRHPSIPIETRRDAVPSAKFFDVWKVLLSAWLGREGPMSARILMARSGAAYPTVADTLKRLEHRGELVRGKGRSVQLKGWPRATMTELVPLLPALRRTVWFADRTGSGISAEWLLKRLGKVVPLHVAIGGVEGARTLDPSFDLVGLPRLDLTVHVPRGEDVAWFVSKLDPGLGRCPTDQGAVLAVHQLTRTEPLFTSRRNAMPLADPAEVVLDLSELRLGEQRDALVRTLRQGDGI